MSKKILKRSLALGALMAFVITGSAWAAEELKADKTVNGIVYTHFDGWYNPSDVGTGDSNAQEWKLNGNTLTVNSCKDADRAIYIEGGRIIGDENSSLVLQNGGFMGSGKIDVGTLIVNSVSSVDSDKNAITSYYNYFSGPVYYEPGKYNVEEEFEERTIIKAKNIVLNSKEGNGIILFSNNNPNDVDEYSMEVIGFDSLKVDVAGSGLSTGQAAEGTIKVTGANDGKLGIVDITAGETAFLVHSFTEKILADAGIVYKNSISISAQDVIAKSTWSGDPHERKGYAVCVAKGNESTIDITATGKVDLEGPNGAIKAVEGGIVNITAGTANITGKVIADGTVNLQLGKDFTWNASNTGKNSVTTLNGNGTVIVATADDKVTVGGGDAELTVRVDGAFAEVIASKSGEEQANELKTVAGQVTGVKVTQVGTTEGEIVGAITADYANGAVSNVKETVNTTNQAIGEAAVAVKAHYRAHMNDMNKRMGELRNANGEHGVWTRMVRGESEYEGMKAQYNQYQLGYDEKLSVDKRWTVGAAVTFAEGEGSFGKGSTEDDSTAFAIYGSKLNDDGTFVDLIARYAHMESDVTVGADKGDYDVNGYSVSAEFGKRIQQGKGFWIEPQVELTYGTVDSAEYVIGGKTVQVGDMDSLIGRVGFSLGKDIKQGNVYARASYLYDFDGETESTFGNGSVTRTIEEDLGGGWWEVGVGANINLSKATYIYADVEKTFGGEVDTNWQWNLGVRYSF